VAVGWFSTRLAAMHLLGRVNDMPHSEYLRVEAVSNSGLKRLRKSPWHYNRLLRGSVPEPEPTREIRQGSVTHTLFLEGIEVFGARYVVGPDISKNSNAWKEWKAQQERAGKEIIDEPMREAAYAMSDALASHPEVSRLWRDYPGMSEVSLFWDEGGVYSKARIDRLLDAVEGHIIVDLKTGGDMSLGAFTTTCARLGYAHQAAWYSRAVKAVTGRDVVGYKVIACEQSFPYAVTTFYFGEAVLAQANEHIDRLLAQYRYCTQMDDWPGYPSEQTIETMPAWAFT